MTILSLRDLEIYDLLNGRDPRLFDRNSFKSYMHPAQEAAEHARKLAADIARDAETAAFNKEIDDLVRESNVETMVADAPVELITKADPAPALVPALPPTITPAPVRAPTAPPARAISGYEFPIAHSTLTSAQELREALQNLTAEFGASKNYGPVREQFCAASIALNTQRLWAPRFRTQPKVNPFRKLAPLMQALHKDHLVIDAHWLWANKHRAPFSSKYERVLDSTQPFDFALAAEYAQEKWTSDFRAEHLGLASQLQWQLCTTKSKPHADSHRLLVDGDRAGTTKAPALITRIKKAIATWAYSSRPIQGQEQAYADLWLAREMLGAKASAKDIARLAGLMAGTVPLEASTVIKKLKRLDIRLAAS